MNEEQSKPQPDTMRQAILDSIKSGSVSRKPRWQFILQGAFAAIGVLLVLLAAVYLGSAIIFALRVNGSFFLPTLGFAGVPEFLRSLPWVLLVLSVIFVVLLYYLVKRYAFAYGRPFLYSALGIVVIVAASAVLVGFTSFHKGIFQRARDGQIPFAGTPFFENFGQQPHDVTIGVIKTISATSWVITNREGSSYMIVINSNISVPQNAAVGDEVVVLGSRHDHTIDAEAIRPLEHGYGGDMEMPEYPNTPMPQAPTAPSNTTQGSMMPYQPAATF